MHALKHSGYAFLTCQDFPGNPSVWPYWLESSPEAIWLDLLLHSSWPNVWVPEMGVGFPPPPAAHHGARAVAEVVLCRWPEAGALAAGVAGPCSAHSQASSFVGTAAPVQPFCTKPPCQLWSPSKLWYYKCTIIKVFCLVGFFCLYVCFGDFGRFLF